MADASAWFDLFGVQQKAARQPPPSQFTFETSALMRESPASSRLPFSVQALPVPTGFSGVINPCVICLQPNEALLFDLSGAASGEYPVYMPDNLINTNPNFDYGYFRELATRVALNASAVQLFIFSFTEPGLYVFADSTNTNKLTIIKVLSS